jgi:probable rRNA maturation factor
MSNYRINIENIYPALKVKKRQIKDIAQTVLSKEGISEAEINIILVDDNYIIRLNHEFLNKEKTTDVISFNLTDNRDRQLVGEIYANVEQIIRQAGDYHVPFNKELSRIIIHGLLHLIGFDDHTDEEKQIMTEKEDHYLAILPDEL